MRGTEPSSVTSVAVCLCSDPLATLGLSLEASDVLVGRPYSMAKSPDATTTTARLS